MLKSLYQYSQDFEGCLENALNDGMTGVTHFDGTIVYGVYSVGIETCSRTLIGGTMVELERSILMLD